MSSEQKVLVTGGAGFIGANFIHQWLAGGLGPLVNLDKLTYAGNPASLAGVSTRQDYLFVQGDIGDAGLVTRLLREHRPTAVVNFAAESHVDRSIHGPAEFVQTNVVGTFTLLEAARDYWQGLPADQAAAFRFLHVSTDEVFGSLDGQAPAFTEAHPYQPNSPYSASKAAADHLVRAYYHTYGLPVLTTNCSNNYGPYQFPEKLIPLVIHNALAGEALPVYGDGQNIRDWLYVTDHCEAIVKVLQAGRLGETYNIGGNCERTNLQVVELICDTLDRLQPRQEGGSRRDLITFVSDRPGHDRRYAIDAGKIERELGWQPRETFESALPKTIQWYLDNQAWVAQVISGEYRNWIDTNYGEAAEKQSTGGRG